MCKDFFCCLTLTFIFYAPLVAQQLRQFDGAIGYIEIGGNSGPAVSINVEHLMFANRKFYINGHLGYGIGRVDGNSAYAIPVGFNVFHGVKSSHIEVGAGLTYVKGYRFYYSKGQAVLSKALYFAPNIAYRFQKPSGGLFLRATFTPLFRIKEYTEPDWFPDSMKTYANFGIALGYFFAPKKETE
jgi:hypothetical protein